MAEQRYCPKCRKTMADTNFYTYKNKEKAELCKACLTMHINNWEPDTFLWLLEKFDVPWIESEWNILRDRAYQKDPHKINGMSVFGKYLSKMKLKQWMNYGWADTERLKALADERREAASNGQSVGISEDKIEEMRKALEKGEITEAQFQTYAAINEPEPSYVTEAPPQPESNSPYPVNGDFVQVDLPDVGADLTEEDKIFLAMKWGRLYRADEWVWLEKKYEEFMNSFDIQGAARIDTLIMICKTSLKMNQAIDAGDVDSYQKLSRVYDAMMKAAKFTEAQNKDGNSDFLNSIGEMVSYCEAHGGQIPKFDLTVDKDIVDTVIRDNKTYIRNLIYEDKALAQEIEKYLKNKEIADQMKRDRDEARAKGLDERELTEDDYVEFNEMLEEQKEEDQRIEAGGVDIESTESP